jgi:hypothetical protein
VQAETEAREASVSKRPRRPTAQGGLLPCSHGAASQRARRCDETVKAWRLISRECGRSRQPQCDCPSDRHSPTRPRCQRWKHGARSAGLQSRQISREPTMSTSNACAKSGSTSWSGMLRMMSASTWMRMMRTSTCASPPFPCYVCARVCGCTRRWSVGVLVRTHAFESHSAVQGSDSDEEVTSKKRKATKRRSTRTQGGKKQAVSLSKNFTEVRSTVQPATYPLLLLVLRQSADTSRDAHPAAGDNGVRQVSEACS